MVYSSRSLGGVRRCDGRHLRNLSSSKETTNPVVCVDETSKQHIKETRHPLAMACGIPSRYDSEYQRNGVSNLFMIFAHFRGFGMLKSLTNARALILLISVEIWLIFIFETLKKLLSSATTSIRISRLRCIRLFHRSRPGVLLKSWSSTIPRSMGVG